MAKATDNILSEPFLGELADRESEIHSKHTAAAPSELVCNLREKLASDQENVELWIELGRAYRRQQMHREAIDCYSQGISRDPFHWLLYRHRGHEYLNVSKYPESVADFTMAVRLAPDNWDSWYHMGAALFMLGEFEKAERAYARCYELPCTLESRIAVTDWYCMTLMRQGKNTQVQALLEPFTDGMEIKRNFEYYQRLLMYKGLRTPEQLLENMGKEDLAIITTGFGVANYYYCNGEHEKGDQVVELILKEGEARYWSAFGYQAAWSEKYIRQAKR